MTPPKPATGDGDVECLRKAVELIKNETFYCLLTYLPLTVIIKAANDYLNCTSIALLILNPYGTSVSGEQELKLGGLIYAFGVVFFKSDGKVPCAHAIWHLFVAGAASTHYFAILNNLFK